MKCSACHARYEDSEPQCPKCGAAPATRKQTAESLANAPRIAPTRQCHAHGCPLSGTFNPVIYGENTGYWVCFIHSDLPIGEWQRATLAVNRNIASLRTIPDDYAFRSAMRDAVAGKEVSEKYWQADGVTRNAYLSGIRAARKDG